MKPTIPWSMNDKNLFMTLVGQIHTFKDLQEVAASFNGAAETKRSIGALTFRIKTLKQTGLLDNVLNHVNMLLNGQKTKRLAKKEKKMTGSSLDWATVAEAAHLLKCSQSHVRYLIKHAKVRSVTMKGLFMVPVDDLKTIKVKSFKRVPVDNTAPVNINVQKVLEMLERKQLSVEAASKLIQAVK